MNIIWEIIWELYEKKLYMVWQKKYTVLNIVIQKWKNTIWAYDKKRIKKMFFPSKEIVFSSGEEGMIFPDSQRRWIHWGM